MRISSWCIQQKRWDSEQYSSHSQERCHHTCRLLSPSLEDEEVSFPGNAVYEFEQLYWSLQQAEVQPACRVTPISAEDVSTTTQVLKSQGCQFAVKSGGHAFFAGASNIGSAVVIDLSNLNQVKISTNKTEVSVGAGTQWSNLYPLMRAAEIRVIGGRFVGMGVEGLTLGGGIPLHSGRSCQWFYSEFQPRIAPRSVWALRGGGNNFGIVTRFDLASFEQGDMWGGMTISNATEPPNAFEALVSFNINHAPDPFAAVFLAYAYLPSAGTTLVSATLNYGIPIIDPAIFSNFTNLASISSSLRITNLTSLVNSTAATQPPGLRESYWTLTMFNDADLMNDICKILDQEVQNINNATNVIPAIVFQPISKPIISQFSKNGGNALGITTEDGPLICK
ncbi:hypothetical protein OCU04_006056 [Sclerotinia nivalis]|uniref:FAD-binding PCMH-type domain-containing protein n=1 Tax=Sclerotinia nivalis TaxID=352851 RepID=A0A9X0AQP3_9HELO|nr:hypothetical protein OCU04_006056 [Sclerotinia nivalis]